MKRYVLPNGIGIFHNDAGETKALYDEIFTQECYAMSSIEINEANTIIDVGANIGLAALFFHKKAKNIRLHCFEPALQICEVLRQNIISHGIDACVHEQAVSNFVGKADFTFYPNNSMMSGMHCDTEEDSAVTREFMRTSGFAEEDIPQFLGRKFQAVPTTCDVTTLSDFILSDNIRHIHLLKIDVEKSELEVLEGIEPCDWPKISQIVVEVHDVAGRCSAIRKMLEDHNYNVWVTQTKSLKNTGLFDIIASRR